MIDTEVRADPLYSQLAVARQDRAVFVDFTNEPGPAFRPQTVLSLTVLLDWLVPRLAAAVDGDPATTA